MCLEGEPQARQKGMELKMEVNKTNNNEVNKLNDVALGICQRLDVYKNSIKKDMVKGDTNIIEGIELVQRFIREINPVIFEEKICNDLEFMLDNYRKLKESKMQSINNFMSYGIIQSKWIVTNYIHHYMLAEYDKNTVKVKKRIVE